MTAPEQTPPPLDPDVLERLDAAATPAPWWAWDRGVGWMLALGTPADIDEHGRPREYLPEGIAEGTLTEPDAKLIAALRNAAQELIRAGRDRDGARDALRRVQERYDEARAAQERLADDRENIHTRLLDALEQTGWIEPEQRDRIDPLGAAVLVADALTQSSDAKQAVMQMANDTNARLRALLLAALGTEDDGRTGLDEYIRRLVAERDGTVRDRDRDGDRAEADRLRELERVARDWRAARLPAATDRTAVRTTAGRLAAAVDALDALPCPGELDCRKGHRCPEHRDADGVVDRVLLDATGAEARLSAIRSWMATYPAVPEGHDGPLDVEMLFVQRLREFLGPDTAETDLRPILAAIDNALRNGSHMTGANYAFALLCDRLGVEPDALEFRPDWARPDGGDPR